MQCVILAGGLGTRMKHVAQDLPKSLIPVQGHPFLHYQLSWLAKQGVKEVVLCVGHGGEQIERYAQDGSTWGLFVRYVKERTPLRGTGGALRLAYDQGCLEPEFLVTYGDSFLPIDFSWVWTYFQKRKEPALMVLLKNKGRWERSNASFDGHHVVVYDKKSPSSDMAYVDYGLSAMRASIVKKDIPAGAPYDLADLFNKLSKNQELAGLEVPTRFYEIGSPEGLKDFELYLTTTTA